MCEKSQKGKRENVAYYSVLSLASIGPAAFHVLSLVRYYYHCYQMKRTGSERVKDLFKVTQQVR